jgi:hypothetical protein
MNAAGVDRDPVDGSPVYVNLKLLEEKAIDVADLPDTPKPTPPPPSSKPIPTAVSAHRPEPSGGGGPLSDTNTFDAAAVADSIHTGKAPTFTGYGSWTHVSHRWT